MTPTRRDFFRLAAGATAVSLPVTTLAARSLAEPDAPTSDRRPAEIATQAIGRKRIPKTGELLPMIGLGTSPPSK